MSKSRPASHSGTWYESDRSRLTMQIDSCLSSEKIVKCKALIAPHAGFSYSGPCAGKIYSQIETSNIKTIFLLGPSHHAYVNGVSLSSFGSYETPLGNIEIDLQITNELQKSGLFTVMEDQVDISEHSLELHLPFIFKIMHGKIFKLVPLLIGHLDLNSEDQYTKILQHYFTDLSTLFIFSSDFCNPKPNPKVIGVNINIKNEVNEFIILQHVKIKIFRFIRIFLNLIMKQ
jgi:AmmeMemoRadiSam system protein B